MRITDISRLAGRVIRRSPRALSRSKCSRAVERWVTSPRALRSARGNRSASSCKTMARRITNSSSPRSPKIANTREAMKKNPDMEHDDPNAKRLLPHGHGEIVWKFTKRGQFEFACLIPGHYEKRMFGKIIVK